MDCDQSELITLLGYDCLFKTLIFNTTCETITQKTSVVKYVNLKLCINTDLCNENPGISNRRGGGRVLKKINYKLYKHYMLTTIKVYANYTTKTHKNKLKKFQTVSQSGILEPGASIILRVLGLSRVPMCAFD